MSIVSLARIGYHCNCLDGQLNWQAFTHCTIGRATKLSVVLSVICGMAHDVWAEDPIPYRQLCIHKTPHKPNHQCSYPCPYSTTTSGWTCHNLQDEAVLNYELMDFSDISSDLPDIMMTMSDDDIPDLVDISECLDNIQHGEWFA